MSNLYDTHCHLNLNLFEKDLEEVIRRAEASGVTRILVPGVDLPTSRRAVEIAEQFSSVYSAVGIHPNEANLWDSQTAEQIAALALHPRVVAVGEIGLDFYRDSAPREAQLHALKAQLDLARDIDKPVILHSRLALDALLPIIFKWQSELASGHLQLFPGILHAFEGDLSDGQRAIEHYFRIGIGGPLTYKNAHQKQELAVKLPLEFLLLETDAPFLAPHPYRGQRNEPGMLVEVARKLALLRSESIETIQTATSRAADQLFGWSSPL